MLRSRVLRLSVAIGSLALAAGCAGAVPSTHGDAILYRDVERVVHYAETKGWSIDRLELEDALPDALLSVCQSPPETRARVLAWVDGRLAEAGDLKAAYRRSGGDLDAIGELVTLSRVRDLLSAANQAAATDCPFWLEARESFRGRQIADDRWQLSLGAGGKGIIGLDGIAEPAPDVTAGGAGRVLLLRNWGPRWGAGLGLEFGGSADFIRDEAGNRESLIFAVDTVFPAVVRYRVVSLVVEAEGGLLLHANEVDRDLVPGLHVGVAVGGLGLRERWFVPGVAFAVSYEQTFAAGGDKDLYLLKIGLRVSADLDL